MTVALITGSSGLIGSEACLFYAKQGYDVVGIDNDMRAYFFGQNSSTKSKAAHLQRNISNFKLYNVDIRDYDAISKIFSKYKPAVVIHTAAQPSHDWAANEPFTDFSVNASGTLNLLEATRNYANDAVFIFTSTNKVYGDRPNMLPLIELDKRYEISEEHAYYKFGINEEMSIDNSKHSLFGASKVAADILVQEYGKYFGLKTGCFRGGCLTGPMHSGAQLHGFLSYLATCIKHNVKYKIFGYNGKQVRDNIHSYDLVNMFWHFTMKPKSGVVYNAGGSRHSNISMLEAISKIENITGIAAEIEYCPDNRIGDHIWYISDIRKFREDYPGWEFMHDIDSILKEICEAV